MFDYAKCTRKLGDFGKWNKSKQRNFIEDLLSDKEFCEFLFKPKGIPNLAEVAGELFAGMCRPAVIKTLCKYVEEEGYSEFNRTHATFFYSICELALETNNERAEENSQKKKSGEISSKEFQERNDKIEAYAKQVNKLFKATKKIVKKDAKQLSEETGVPDIATKMALYMIPEVSMIDRYKIGRYLSRFLTSFYEMIEEKYAENKNVINPSSINWKGFFKELFGKDNLAEVATFLLLEGHNNRDKYSCDAVLACWDSLTEFALKQINDAPEQLRDQMLELYLKRISKMFSNGTYELRVDLLSIPELSGRRYPALASTINKYMDKLESILKK